MRIALVTTSFPACEGDPSGHFVKAEAEALRRAGHEVTVLAPAPAVSAEDRSAFGWPGVAARVAEDPRRLVDAARWVGATRRRLTRLQPHRVVAHWAVPCAWPIAMASTAGLEVVSHGGDVRLLARLPRVAREAVVGAIAARALRWRFVSEPLMESLLSALSPPLGARVAGIARIEEPALEMPDVSGAVATVKRGLDGARVAVSVGRLVRSKRVDRAIEHVARTREVDALVVVGDGPERRSLEALARTRAVDARFVGLVPRREALAWIAAAEVVLFASEAEGASSVLREAAALGTRVLVLTDGTSA